MAHPVAAGVREAVLAHLDEAAIVGFTQASNPKLSVALEIASPTNRWLPAKKIDSRLPV